MSYHPSDQIVQIPAAGPKLEPAIKLALTRLQSWCKAEGFDWDGIQDEDGRLWKELLTQSADNLRNETTPCIRRGDLSSPVGVILDGRRWNKFLKWFDREVRLDLTKECQQANLPMLYCGRLSDMRGGRPESSEALYFLSYMDHQAKTGAVSEYPDGQESRRAETHESAGSTKYNPAFENTHLSVNRAPDTSLPVGVLLLAHSRQKPRDFNTYAFILFLVISACFISVHDFAQANILEHEIAQLIVVVRDVFIGKTTPQL